MNRRSWGFVDTVAYSWAIECLFWIVVLAGYVAMTAFHAESYVWVLGLVALAAIALGTEWWVSSYRCPACDFVGTRNQIAERSGGQRT